MNYRHRERKTVFLPFNVYSRSRYLGTFFSRNVSQEGLFLNMESDEFPTDDFVDLQFRVNGVGYFVRGMVAHQIQGQGVGILLAYWRTEDFLAHGAYRQYITPNRANLAA